MMYAIVDIETTGGHAYGNGITEIAICLHDGTRVVEQYHSLVNPGQAIPRLYHGTHRHQQCHGGYRTCI